MQSILRFVVLLALVVWLGGILFFATVPPVVFSHLGNVQNGRVIAGDIVGQSLRLLHGVGLVSGVVFLLASIAQHRKVKLGRHYLVLAMLVLTAISQYALSGRMAFLRAENSGKEERFWGESERMEFDRLHQFSTVTEGAILLMGLGVVVAVARKP
jgi:hypothetical protein